MAEAAGLLGGAADVEDQVSSLQATASEPPPKAPEAKRRTNRFDEEPPSAQEAYDIWFDGICVAEEEERERYARRKRWETEGRWMVAEGGGCVGLTNIKNTCWMNSVVQSMAHLEPFVACILDLEARDPGECLMTPKLPPKVRSSGSANGGDGAGVLGAPTSPASSSSPPERAAESRIISQGLRELFAHLWQDRQARRSVVPDRFHMCLTMNASWEQKKAFRAQQDAQEFLLFMLNKLHEELDGTPTLSLPARRRSKSPEGGRDSPVGARTEDPINGLFQGVLESSIECSVCGNKSTREEDFLHLSLPVVNSDSDALPCEPIGLYAALSKELESEERLVEDNRWSCSECNDRVDAIRRTRLKSLPEIVILHLKRFAYSMSGRVRKVSTPVELEGSGPAGLDGIDLSRFLPRLARDGAEAAADEPALYDIASVVHHHGKDAVCGHYTAHCRHVVDGQWYCFNDDKVSPIHASEAWLPVEAYILCLVRKKPEPAFEGAAAG